MSRRTVLHVAEILAWADEYRERTGKFPTADSGVVVAKPDEKWVNIDQALRVGLRISWPLVTGTTVGGAPWPSQPEAAAEVHRSQDPGLGRCPPAAHGALADVKVRADQRCTG